MHFNLDSHDAQATTEDDPTPILRKRRSGVKTRSKAAAWVLD
jgi:hypothetical protein